MYLNEGRFWLPRDYLLRSICHNFLQDCVGLFSACYRSNLWTVVTNRVKYLQLGNSKYYLLTCVTNI